MLLLRVVIKYLTKKVLQVLLYIFIDTGRERRGCFGSYRQAGRVYWNACLVEVRTGWSIVV